MEQITSLATKSSSDPNSSKNAQRAGSVRWRNGKADARLSLGVLGRKTFQLPTCKTERQAEARRALLAELADRLIAAGAVEMGLPLLEKAAAREGTALDDVCRAIDVMAKGDVVKRSTGETTFRDVATQWLTGELSRQFKDHIKPRKEAKAHLSQLESHVFPLVGDIPMSRFTLAHAQEVMRRLPEHYSAGTRRCMALLLHRIVGLAVFPLNLLPHQPLPKGFVPPKPPRKAMAHLYPNEEAQLLACRTIPLGDRVLYGFLDREGMRSDEAFGVEWSDLDLERGAVVLDANKTNDPRAWALAPDVVRALKVWRALREKDDGPHLFHRGADGGARKTPGHTFVFYRRSDLAARVRDDLKAAEVKREVLFEHNATRQRMRAHDLRATFITIGLANGRTETWIMDRTGHRSSEMVNAYRRAARTFAELGQGPLRPMDEAIPEIAEVIAAERAAEERAATRTLREADATSAAKQRRASDAAKGERSIATTGEAAPAARSATGDDAMRGSAVDRKVAADDATRMRDEKPSRGTANDVAVLRAGWSVAGPSSPERSRAAASRPKNAGKDRTSQPFATSVSISKSKTGGHHMLCL